MLKYLSISNSKGRSLRKKHCLIIIVIVFAIAIISGCLKPPQEKIKGPRRSSITSVKIKKGDKDSKTASVVNFVKSYLQTAFLDLKIAKQNGYKDEISDFFDDSISDKAARDLQILSLGSDGKKLDIISKNDLQFKTISIYYDKLRNTSLSTVELVFNAQYQAQYSPVFLKINGTFSLHKEKENWKIFSYKIKQELRTSKQNLRSKRDNGSKS